MPLRRLTRFSRLELEDEKAELETHDRGAERDPRRRALLRKVVGDELPTMAKQYGTPRRTVLLESAGQPVTAAVPLEVADDPCLVFLSSTGLLARTGCDEAPGRGGARAKHDAIVAAAAATARGTVGVVTSAGRLLKLDVLDLPVLPSPRTHRSCRAARRSASSCPWSPASGWSR